MDTIAILKSKLRIEKMKEWNGIRDKDRNFKCECAECGNEFDTKVCFSVHMFSEHA